MTNEGGRRTSGQWSVYQCRGYVGGTPSVHGRPHKWGQLTPWKNGRKIKKRKRAKKTSFLCSCYILRAIKAGRCRERRYVDHIFIQIYFRMHHFVVKFFKIFFASGGKGALTP